MLVKPSRCLIIILEKSILNLTVMTISLLISTSAIAQQKDLPDCNLFNQYIESGCKGTVWIGLGWYSGEMHNGKPEGIGTYTYDKQDGYYIGEFHGGKPNGSGTRIYSDGRKTIGQFRDGKIVGKATESYPSGEQYIGEFKDGMRNGDGVLTFTDGSKFIGQFRNDTYNGKGTYIGANGEKESGIYRDGKLLGSPSNTTSTDDNEATKNLQGAILSDAQILSKDQDVISMEKEGGVYVVPINLNGAITLNAIIDSGASDVSIPADVVSTLIRAKTISQEDFLGLETYTLADGTRVPSTKFRIKNLKVGNRYLEDVTASIASSKAVILLGQSFLGRFKSWSIDNEKHTLNLQR